MTAFSYIKSLNGCCRIKIQLLVKGSGKGRTGSDSFAINQQRQNLRAKVDGFQNQRLSSMKINPTTMPEGGIHKTVYADDLNELEEDEGNWLAAEIEETVEEEEPEVTPEKVLLYLPSNLTLQQRKQYGLQCLGNAECELREGQANDSLERLRESLAEKSLRFRREVRLAKGQKKSTRAWDSVHRVDDHIRQAVTTYRAARHAIGELGGAAVLERFQEIKKADLKMSGDVVEENRVGQRSSILPWFWRLDRKTKANCGDNEKECEYSRQWQNLSD